MMKAFIGAVCMYGIKSCRFDNNFVTYILMFFGIDLVVFRLMSYLHALASIQIIYYIYFS